MMKYDQHEHVLITHDVGHVHHGSSLNDDIMGIIWINRVHTNNGCGEDVGVCHLINDLIISF